MNIPQTKDGFTSLVWGIFYCGVIAIRISCNSLTSPMRLPKSPKYSCIN